MPDFVNDEDETPTPEQMAEFVLTATSEQLDLLQRLMQVRRTAIKEMADLVKEQELYVGDRAYITGVTPQKLNGKFCTIIEIPEVGLYKIKLDVPDKKWHIFNVRARNLEKINH